MIFIPITQREEYLDVLKLGNGSNKRSADHVPLIDFIIKRLLYTLTYVVSKTSFFSLFQSVRNNERFTSLASTDLFDDLFDAIEAYHGSDEVF
jgi:hypothetical protein